MNDLISTLNDRKLSEKEGQISNDMFDQFSFFKKYKREIMYQTGVALLLFLSFSYNQDETVELSFTTLFASHKLAFFCNYLASASVINYVFLPKLYYRKKIGLFFISVASLITMVILIDELILEQIYFPDTRGASFPGILFTLLETLPIMIIMVSFKFAWDFIRKQKELDSLKNLVRESEIQHLKSQINPHFLFNNLNNLYSFALRNSPKTPEIILELATVLRYMLYDSKEDAVTLTREVKHLNHYMSLFQMQIENRGLVTLREEIESEDFMIPPLVLVVFVENAFKHSSGTQIANIKIDVTLNVEENGHLHFSCKNNYMPDYDLSKTSSGIGLDNVKKRLNLLYPKNHQLTIKDDGEDFEVGLSVNLRKKGE